MTTLHTTSISDDLKLYEEAMETPTAPPKKNRS